MAALTSWLGFDTRGVAVIGEIPNRLPSFGVPTLELGQARELASGALAIAVLGLLEAISMSKALAAVSGQKLDMNQQCLSEGLANLTGSFFQCMPGSGSLTRSAINQQAGAVSQWSGVISAAAVALTMLAFAPYARFVPRAALAGILMVTAWNMVDWRSLFYHLRTTRFDAAIVSATALAAVGISIEFCVLIGVFMSFMLTVPRAGQMLITEFTLTGAGLRELLPGDPPCSRILVFGLEGEMFFGATAALDAHFAEMERRIDANTRVLVLRLKRARNPDAVGLTLLENFLSRVKARGVHVLLCGVRTEFAREARAHRHQRAARRALVPRAARATHQHDARDPPRLRADRRRHLRDLPAPRRARRAVRGRLARAAELRGEVFQLGQAVLHAQHRLGVVDVDPRRERERRNRRGEHVDELERRVLGHQVAAALLAVLAVAELRLREGRDVLCPLGDLHGFGLPQAEGVHRSARPRATRTAMAVAHRLGISVDLELDRPAEASSGVFHGRDLSIDDSWLYMQPYTPEMSADEAEELIEAVGRECIANKVRLLNRAVTAIYDEALRPHELKISQMSVLVTVSVLGRASPGAVGRRLHMEKSTLSRNVDRMRARGWLEAAPTENGRDTELYVTAAGRRLLKKVHPAWSAAQERAAELLGEPGVRGITRTVDSLASRLKGERQ